MWAGRRTRTRPSGRRRVSDTHAHEEAAVRAGGEGRMRKVVPAPGGAPRWRLEPRGCPGHGGSRVGGPHPAPLPRPQLRGPGAGRGGGKVAEKGQREGEWQAKPARREGQARAWAQAGSAHQCQGAARQRCLWSPLLRKVH